MCFRCCQEAVAIGGAAAAASLLHIIGSDNSQISDNTVPPSHALLVQPRGRIKEREKEEVANYCESAVTGGHKLSTSRMLLRREKTKNIYRLACYS